jgi:hypothetical protein
MAILRILFSFAEKKFTILAIHVPLPLSALPFSHFYSEKQLTGSQTLPFSHFFNDRRQV